MQTRVKEATAALTAANARADAAESAKIELSHRLAKAEEARAIREQREAVSGREITVEEAEAMASEARENAA